MSNCPEIGNDALSPKSVSKSSGLPEVMIESLSKRFQQKRDDGHILYFVTVTYKESNLFPLSPQTINRNLRQFHRCLLERLAGTHQISRTWFRKIEPEVHAFVDRPGSKHKSKKRLKLSIRTSTLHHHAIMIVHPSLAARMDELIGKVAQKHFLSDNAKHCYVRAIDVQRIRPTYADIQHVAEYSAVDALTFLEGEYNASRFDPRRRKFIQNELGAGQESGDRYLVLPASSWKETRNLSSVRSDIQ